jgi:cell division protein FtsQ
MNTRNLRTLKRRKEKKRLKFIITLTAFFLFAIFGVYFFIANYSLAKEIVFIGNHHIKNDELMSLIKIKRGDKLFSVSGKELYTRLSASPWVKDATVRKELSGRMLINITEAVPVAILNISDRHYLIDKDGNILEPVKEGTVLFLTVIKDIDPDKNKDTYAEAVKFVNILHAKRVMASEGILEITGHRPEDITLKIDNILIKIGAGDFDKKLERLQFVKNEIEARNMLVEYIDLRFANKIVVKPLPDIKTVQKTVANKDAEVKPNKKKQHDKRKKKKK